MVTKNWIALACASIMLPATTPVAPAQPGPSQATETQGTLQAHHENVLGTALELAVRAPNQATAKRAEAAALHEIDRQSALLSAWDPHSEFSRWQQTRNIPVPVSPELLYTLARFDIWRIETNGTLNPSAEAAAALWRTAALTQRPPTPAQLAKTRQQMQQPHWTLDPAAGTATHLSDTPLALATFVKSRIAAAAANAAIHSGATGVMLNLGGDIVTRGRLTQRVDIANPRADAENDPALDTVTLQDRAIATSGGYRRGVHLAGQHLSHLIDARTAMPATEILSSTVIANDAETAGALATALAILPNDESAALVQRHPGTAYLLVRRDGSRIESPNWARYQEPRLHTAAYRIDMAPNLAETAPAAMAPTPATAAASAWNGNFELLVKLNLPRIDDSRYRRPFVAVWIEDENKYPVRTLALWFQKPKWLPELKTWYRDDRVRNLSEGTDLSTTISSATRGPGTYTLKWDGKDNEGKLVKAGRYTLCAEASREHGGYGVVHHPMDFNGQPQQLELPTQPEIGTVALDYRKK